MVKLYGKYCIYCARRSDPYIESLPTALVHQQLSLHQLHHSHPSQRLPKRLSAPPRFRLVIRLVPRPHPLTRRNGLVNQVELLGLAGSLATGNLATFCGKHAQKKYGYSNGDEYILLLFYVIISDLAISMVFHRFGGISPKNLTVHQTVSHREARAGWAGD